MTLYHKSRAAATSLRSPNKPSQYFSQVLLKPHLHLPHTQRQILYLMSELADGSKAHPSSPNLWNLSLSLLPILIRPARQLCLHISNMKINHASNRRERERRRRVPEFNMSIYHRHFNKSGQKHYTHTPVAQITSKYGYCLSALDLISLWANMDAAFIQKGRVRREISRFGGVVGGKWVAFAAECLFFSRTGEWKSFAGAGWGWWKTCRRSGLSVSDWNKYNSVLLFFLCVVLCRCAKRDSEEEWWNADVRCAPKGVKPFISVYIFYFECI